MANILDKALNYYYQIGAPKPKGSAGGGIGVNMNVQVDVTKNIKDAMLGTAAIIAVAVIGNAVVRSKGR